MAERLGLGIIFEGTCGVNGGTTQQDEIAPVPVSRDCRSSLEHGIPCHHGEGVK